MGKYLNFPSAVVKKDSIVAIGVMVERRQVPGAVSDPRSMNAMKIEVIPLLIAYTKEGSMNLGQVRDHETAIEVKDLFFELCEERITVEEFHRALLEMSERTVEEDEEQAVLSIKGEKPDKSDPLLN